MLQGCLPTHEARRPVDRGYESKITSGYFHIARREAVSGERRGPFRMGKWSGYYLEQDLHARPKLADLRGFQGDDDAIASYATVTPEDPDPEYVFWNTFAL